MAAGGGGAGAGAAAAAAAGSCSPSKSPSSAMLPSLAALALRHAVQATEGTGKRKGAGERAETQEETCAPYR